MIQAGQLNKRWAIQRRIQTLSDAGGTVNVWTTERTVWGTGPEAEQNGDEQFNADHVIAEQTYAVHFRYQPGLSANRRAVLLLDSTTLSSAMNSSVATAPLTAALRFDGDAGDLLLVDSEIMRVTGSETGTTPAVKRGARDTTAASHLIAAVARRVRIYEFISIDNECERGEVIAARVKRVQ